MSERPPISPRSPRAALEPERVPPPPKRSDHARNPWIVVGNAILTIIVVLMIGAGGVYYYGTKVIDAPGPLQQDKVVIIPKHAGTAEIAERLRGEGVIDTNRWTFIGAVLALKARAELKPGEYDFRKAASLRDVITTMVEGKVVEHAFTIPEGLTSEQVVKRLSDDDIFSGAVHQIPGEGTLLPETYKFPRGTTRDQAIRRMQQAQKRLVAEIWKRRSPDLPLQTPQQLVTLASMIEKETSRPDERSRVAAVFVNRLKQKMKLQSDPTIIYGLVGGKATLGRPIKHSDVLQPSPYNTYVINGLPPGPICNPGRASLEAAANPARTRDLYFVADGTGGHVFSETYQQQEKNVAKLRAIEKRNEKEKAEAADDPKPADSAPAHASPAATAPHKPKQATKMRQPRALHRRRAAQSTAAPVTRH
jgi:UPF0755 protein